MISIGIPRDLLYYQCYPMWKTFFEELGAEVVVSSPTTQAMLSEGSPRVVAETCLPTKVFLGHVLSLVKKCDYIFIRAIRSVKNKVYNCSKLLGLPDMTKAVIPESPPILDIDIDINKGKLGLYQAIYKLGRRFTWSPLRVRLNPFIYVLGLREKDKSHKAAMPYLSRHVGGDGWQSVGEKVLYAKEYDGLIHLAPFTCKPEIVAQNIMPSTKENIPVLTILCDEQTTKTGMLTRLEAFVDLLERKRRVGNRNQH